MRDPPKEGVSTNLTANHKGSNLIPCRTKSNEGHAAIQVDVHGVFAWVKNKKNKVKNVIHVHMDCRGTFIGFHVAWNEFQS